MEYFRQALALHQQGQFVEARRLYRLALNENPRHPDTLHLLGLVEIQFGDYAEAERLILMAIEVRGDIPDYYANLGLMLTSLGRLQEAEQALIRAIKLRSDDANLYFLLANVHYTNRQYARAEAEYRLALRLTQQDSQIYLGLANSLIAQQQLQEARDAIAKALQLKPDYAEALGNMGAVLQQLWQLPEAEQYLRRSLAIEPRNAEVLSNLGALLLDTDRHAEAETSLRAALEIRPGSSSAWNNLGNLLLQQRRVTEAKDCFAKAANLSPDYVNAHWNLGLAQLLQGDFANGWEGYEWRTKRSDARHLYPEYPQPKWQGETLGGKRILLYAEQGLGDTLQFVRFVPFVAALGGHVILQCQPALKQLLSSMPGVAAVVATGEPLPPFDVYCPLLSLPYHLGITAEQKIPAHTPYLRVEKQLQQKWKDRVRDSGRLKVGLVWSGAPRPDDAASNLIDRRRSMSLAQFEPLLALADVQFYSLQKGDKAKEAEKHKDRIIDLMGDAHDFTDTAALVTQMDLVISVDTSVVHLAGALAVPTWVLSRFDGCWRWMLEREDTPWYPNMRLFRQPKAGDWDSVITAVTLQLQKLT